MPNKKNRSLFFNRRFWAHFVFWGLQLALFTGLGGMISSNYLVNLAAEASAMPIEMAQVYFINFHLIPKFLYKKQYFSFATWVIITYCIGYIGFHSLSYYFVSPVIFERPVSPSYFTFNPPILWATFVSIYLTAIMGFFKLTGDRNAEEKLAKDYQNEKLEAELKFLKSQIHPHFLFNTLNNLYTLALKKSDKAPHAIEKLANLFRYMSYEANQKKVSLGKEIDNLQNYVSLEQIRYGSRLSTSLNVEGSMENQIIAPLILLPFIENSFKHGVSGDLQDSHIDITIMLNDSKLQMIVKNSIASGLNGTDNSSDHMGYRNGIGLKNVQRRLEIIYKDKHSLNIEESDHYVATLDLDLS